MANKKKRSTPRALTQQMIAAGKTPRQIYGRLTRLGVAKCVALECSKEEGRRKKLRKQKVTRDGPITNASGAVLHPTKGWKT